MWIDDKKKMEYNKKKGYLYSLQNTKSKSLKDENMSYGYKELQDSLFSLNICYPIEENKYITGKEIIKQMMNKSNNKYNIILLLFNHTNSDYQDLRQ